MDFYTVGNAPYINLETFKKDGNSVKTPVWVVQAAGKLYVWTQAKSWKVQRIKNNRRVNICQSDVRGEPKGEWVAANATIYDSNEAMTAMRQRLAEKYGLMFRLFALLGRLRGQSKGYVTIELSPV